VRRFLHQHNCRNQERIEQRLEELKRAVAVTTDPAMLEPGVIMARALVDCIGSLSKAIKELEDKIEEVMRLRTQAWPCIRRPNCRIGLKPGSSLCRAQERL
jgi:hypothetical protein